MEGGGRRDVDGGTRMEERGGRTMDGGTVMEGGCRRREGSVRWAVAVVW